jgi:hypothetical protein
MKFPKKMLPLIDTPHTHNKCKGGRGGGKSFTIGLFLANVMSQVPIQIIFARETQKSLKESSYALMKKSVEILGLTKQFNFIESQGIITSSAGARGVFIGMKDHTIDSIKSYEGYEWVFVEEAHSVSSVSLNTLIPTLRQDGYFKIDLGDGKDRVFPLRMFLYALNPFSWSDPIDLVLPDSRNDTQEIIINHYDNPFFPESLDSERIEAKKTMTTEEYDRIWEGIPYDDAERGVMSRKAVEAAMNRKVEKTGVITTAADIARFGNDKIVFMRRDGMQITDWRQYSKLSTQETARLFNDFSEGADRGIIDDTGVGGGVTDKLNDLRKAGQLKFKSVVPINFGAAAKDKKKYPDIISEMFFSLADQMHAIGLPNHEKLKLELISRNFEYTPDERRKVESKEKYKKRTGLSSPDFADCAIMLFSSPKMFQKWTVI